MASLMVGAEQTIEIDRAKLQLAPVRELETSYPGPSSCSPGSAGGSAKKVSSVPRIVAATSPAGNL